MTTNQSPTRKRPTAGRGYPVLFPSIAGLGLMLLILLLAYKLPCPSNAQYSIFRIVLAMALSGFAVVVAGFFEFQLKQVLTAGGALAVFAFSYIYTPKLIQTTDKCSEPFDYTVFLQDSTGNTPVRKAGMLALLINNEYKKGQIDEDGSTTFKQIPATLHDSSVPVQLQVEGWQFPNGKALMPVRLQGKSAVLHIVRDNSLCCVQGSVMDSRGVLRDATVWIGNNKTVTDERGWFALSIPPAEQREEYRLKVSKEGYRLKDLNVNPRMQPEVNILLQKEN